ncbi:thermonuclease family protein [bacterium]|nr:thermonuclease family protein [bacterium]
MNISQKRLALFILFSVVLTVISCDKKLDKDGGYYDKESKTYKLVRPKQTSVSESSLKVFSPVPEKSQNIQGITTRIDDDAKSIWVKIEDRRPYMVLANSLSSGNRNDKDKELRIILKYVSPTGSVTMGSEFREKWRRHTINILKQQLVDKTVLAEIDYQEKARSFQGTIHTIIQTEDGDRARNINLWMVLQGLSFYFIDQGKSPLDSQFVNAQKMAMEKRDGLWKYKR